MTAILTHYFLFVSLKFLIIDKFKLQEKATLQKASKLIYKLGKCDFCFNFWIAVLAVLFIDAITLKIDEVDLVMPFVIMGIWITLKMGENEQ